MTKKPTLALLALTLLLGMFIGAFIERRKAQLSYHGEISRGGVVVGGYVFSNFMGRPHMYSLYLRQPNEAPISLIFGCDASFYRCP